MVAHAYNSSTWEAKTGFEDSLGYTVSLRIAISNMM